jgi:hypothetical protein
VLKSQETLDMWNGEKIVETFNKRMTKVRSVLVYGNNLKPSAE